MTLRRLEKNKLGIMIRSIYDGNIEQRAVITCVDGADFCTSREDGEK